MQWQLRVRHDGVSVGVIQHLQHNSTVEQLRLAISQLTAIPPQQQILRAGFPPQSIDRPPQDHTIDTYFHNMDTILVSNRTSSKSHKRKRQKHQSSTIDHLAEQLARAAQSPKDTANDVLKAFTKSFGSVLEEREQERLANFRWKAVLEDSAEYHIGNLVKGLGRFSITFKIGKRKTTTEEHMKMPKVLIKAVLEAVMEDLNCREKLKPFNMALYSPRLFWNLAYEYSGSIEDGLCDLLIGHDLDFLKKRRRIRSEKSMISELNKTIAQERGVDDDVA